MALTPKARHAALALARGATQAEAAADVGVAERTVRYWVANAEFRAETARLTDEIVAQGVARLAGLLAKAGNRLDTLLDSADERVRARAVKIVYDKFVSLKTHNEVAAQLDRIQETLRHGHKGGWDDEADDDSTGADGPEPDAPPG